MEGFALHDCHQRVTPQEMRNLSLSLPMKGGFAVSRFRQKINFECEKKWGKKNLLDFFGQTPGLKVLLQQYSNYVGSIFVRLLLHCQNIISRSKFTLDLPLTSRFNFDASTVFFWAEELAQGKADFVSEVNDPPASVLNQVSNGRAMAASFASTPVPVTSEEAQIVAARVKPGRTAPWSGPETSVLRQIKRPAPQIAQDQTAPELGPATLTELQLQRLQVYSSADEFVMTLKAIYMPVRCFDCITLMVR